MIIDMERMDQADISLSDITPSYRYHRFENSYDLRNSPKKTHTLLLFSGCTGDYSFTDGTALHAAENDIVYIPQGLGYAVDFTQRNAEYGCVRIEFRMLQNGESCSLSASAFSFRNSDPKLERDFLDMAEEAGHPMPSRLYIKSKMFHLLDRIHRHMYESGLDRTKFGIIRTGILYLEKDTEQKKSIGEIAADCGVSSVYFRKLFREYAGVSPVEFRIRKKLERAAELLSTGEMNVTETAYACGFDDVCYFERLFRSRMNCTPGEYRRRGD